MFRLRFPACRPSEGGLFPDLVFYHEARSRPARRILLRDPEVTVCARDLLALNLDVGRFQVAVDDSFFVRGFQGIGHLAGAIERLGDTQGAAQGFTFHQLQNKAVDVTRSSRP